MNEGRYSRNEGLVGVEGQRLIAATRVAIAGLGGLGSHVAQQLAYLGVMDFALADDDHVTNSSLNRLIGATDADVVAETPKVEIAERMIKTINPQASVAPLRMRLDRAEARTALAGAGVVFGCLDGDLARLQLSELCARAARPLFDLASDTQDLDTEHPIYGGRVVLANGNGCLLCRDELDQHEIARESEGETAREERQRIYGVRADALGGTGPMVVSVNGTVASLAVTEFIALVTGLRAPNHHLDFRGQVPRIMRSTDPSEGDCYFCAGLWGIGV